MSSIKKDDKRVGNPRPDHVKKSISEKNKISVRGLKLVLEDEFGIVQHVKKVGYDNIVEYLESGWKIKSSRIWMNKDNKHVLKQSKKWKECLEQGWEWGSLSDLNKVKCYHCENYNCKIDHYS